MKFSSSSRERIREIEGGTPYKRHIALSPRTSTGLPTASVGIVLFPDLFENSGTYLPLAAADVGGITLTIYRFLPTLGGRWSKLTALTGIAFYDQLVLPDLGGGWELFLSVSNVTFGAGKVFAAIAELP